MATAITSAATRATADSTMAIPDSIDTDGVRVIAGRTMSSVHVLRCVEVWAGNQQIDSAVSVPGIDASIWSDPYEGDLNGGDIRATPRRPNASVLTGRGQRG